MNKYGYIRVSSKDQNPERQYKALLDYGIRQEHIYADFISGKDFNRPNYMKLVKRLKRGDVLVIKRRVRLRTNPPSKQIYRPTEKRFAPKCGANLGKHRSAASSNR